jgi:hypothetical protein
MCTSLKTFIFVASAQVLVLCNFRFLMLFSVANLCLELRSCENAIFLIPWPKNRTTMERCFNNHNNRANNNSVQFNSFIYVLDNSQIWPITAKHNNNNNNNNSIHLFTCLTTARYGQLQPSTIIIIIIIQFIYLRA